MSTLYAGNLTPDTDEWLRRAFEDHGPVVGAAVQYCRGPNAPRRTATAPQAAMARSTFGEKKLFAQPPVRTLSLRCEGTSLIHTPEYTNTHRPADQNSPN
ncbi:RNA recognition motif domain-containing protein [Streptomyces flaveolus]|uniref:RNA recognition motif domain-containing protein n=1 Tax=Streptomyces flaveolus TaxID=67297 RepID=UPI0036FA0D43